jgi:SAM-dependent methyltransferase
VGSAARRIRFLREFRAFRRLLGSGGRLPLRWADRWPRLKDRTADVKADRAYLLHTAWAARILARLRPAEHVDVASFTYFGTLVSAFVPVKAYDLRRLDVRLAGYVAGTADLTALPFPDHSVASLSCLHAVEHVGLGRYGDRLDPDGDLKAMRELSRVLAPGGSLLFAVPVGRPRIEFNAHRVYAARQIREAFSDLEVVEFALIPDHARDGDLVVGAADDLCDRQAYGCGCWWFRRGV